MSRLHTVDDASASVETQALLEKVQNRLGRVPNLYRTMANSPAALDGYLDFHKALGTGKLSRELREQLALLVAQENNCEYCVSAHTFRGQKIGLSAEELQQNRQADSRDPKTTIALHFAKAVIEARGRVSDADVEAVRQAGFSDGEIAEIVGHVALNIYSNYFNHVAQPELDFPRVSLDSVTEGAVRS